MDAKFLKLKMLEIFQICSIFNLLPFVDKITSSEDEKHWDVLIKYVATNEDIWEMYLSVEMMNHFIALES